MHLPGEPSLVWLISFDSFSGDSESWQAAGGSASLSDCRSTVVYILIKALKHSSASMTEPSRVLNSGPSF